MDTKQGAGLSLVEERVAASKASDGVEFDPTIIIAIISAIIPLIQNCFKPKPQNLRRRFGNKMRVAANLKRECPAMSWDQAIEEAENLFALANKATDAELQMVIDDCCR